MDIRSLNNLKKYIKGWFNSNPFINTVVVSSKNDFNSINDINYPVVHVEYVNTSTNPTYNVYTFSFSIADIQNNKIEYKNVDDIHNDTQLVAQDFIDFHSINDVFEIDENIQIVPFVEENTDRTAGVTFAVRISIFRDKNTCIIPTINTVKDGD